LSALAVLKYEGSHPALPGRERTAPVIASNQAAALAPGGDSLIQHNTAPATFEWTNRGDLASNVGFMSLKLSTN